MSGQHFKSEEFTASQLRAFTTLASAIQISLEAGQRVPCHERPTLFDATARTTKRAEGSDPAGAFGVIRQQIFDDEERLRQRLCRGCPALQACRTYATSGVEISGFVAGGRQQRGTPTIHTDTVAREAS